MMDDTGSHQFLGSVIAAQFLGNFYCEVDPSLYGQPRMTKTATAALMREVRYQQKQMLPPQVWYLLQNQPMDQMWLTLDLLLQRMP
jgi:hypothetical protein